jgi:hypothetical protein
MELFTTIDELKSFEKVDAKVSKKYVPIYTSMVVEALEPEFKMVEGCKIFKTWSTHYVDLKGEDATIRIHNSFDRRWAFGLTLTTADGFPVRVGLDRIVHIGSKAKEFNENFKDAKGDVLKAIANARVFATTLSKTNINADLAAKVKAIVFRKIMDTKGFQTVSNDVDILLDNKSMSVTSYISSTLAAFERGNYTYTVSGVKKVGGKTKSVFNRTQTESLLMDLIEEEFIEYLL